MKKALIICSAGITSMIISKRINKTYKNKDIDITILFALGEVFLKKASDDYDLYILSPQVKHLWNDIEKKIPKKDILYLESGEYSIDEDKLKKLAEKIQERIGGR
ncbi:hypothetical protein [Anaerococcus sp. AGMB09787]|uniref:PTS sugar transporter subunit IIB n=1 Tax=Anaerococcus sp. AGMB09787 TaxID=2922869 RepID=UPI002434179B|nr:hypothetical protein [Anaerococcus sp. AGMB09787]